MPAIILQNDGEFNCAVRRWNGEHFRWNFMDNRMWREEKISSSDKMDGMNNCICSLFKKRSIQSTRDTIYSWDCGSRSATASLVVRSSSSVEIVCRPWWSSVTRPHSEQSFLNERRKEQQMMVEGFKEETYEYQASTDGFMQWIDSKRRKEKKTRKREMSNGVVWLD